MEERSLRPTHGYIPPVFQATMANAIVFQACQEKGRKTVISLPVDRKADLLLAGGSTKMYRELIHFVATENISVSLEAEFHRSIIDGSELDSY
jgi:hypothetical protein